MSNHRGVDLPREQRPGVPMETPPKPAGHAHWTRPDPMRAEALVLKRMELDQLTPVYSTKVEPHGLSGLIKRVAYRIPEHRPAHWLLLLLSDRVDVVESSPVRSIVALGVLAGLGAGVYFATRPRRRRFFDWVF